PGDIADLGAGHADAPGDRRTDGAIAELYLQAFERRLVRIGERTVDVHLGLGVVQRHHRGGIFRDQIGVTRHVAAGLFDLRLGPGDHGLDAADFGLDRAAVEDEQDIALFDSLAVFEFHRDD